MASRALATTLCLSLTLAAAGCASTEAAAEPQDYVLLWLSAGEHRPDSAEAESLLQGHMANMAISGVEGGKIAKVL